MALPKYIRSDELISKNYILELCVLMEKFCGKAPLTYLEVGAYNGIEQSNTLILSDRLGWRGILVEPVEEYYHALIENRPNDICVNALLHSRESSEHLFIKKSGPMSKVEEKHPGPKRTLNSSLRAFGRAALDIFSIKSKNRQSLPITTINHLCLRNDVSCLDFISCDVEGLEYEVLCGVDFNGLGVKAILVECRPKNIMQIIELLIPSGFVLAEAISRFNTEDNPMWDGTHQDYLFLNNKFYSWMMNN